MLLRMNEQKVFYDATDSKSSNNKMVGMRAHVGAFAHKPTEVESLQLLFLFQNNGAEHIVMNNIFSC